MADIVQAIYRHARNKVIVTDTCSEAFDHGRQSWGDGGYIPPVFGKGEWSMVSMEMNEAMAHLI